MQKLPEFEEVKETRRAEAGREDGERCSWRGWRGQMEQGLVGQERSLGFLSTMSRGREQAVHLEGCYCGQLKVA